MSSVQEHRDRRPIPLGVLDRGNGCYTPVVALDELPPSLLLKELPRRLKSDQIHNYQVLGKQPRNGFFIEARQDHNGHQMLGSSATCVPTSALDRRTRLNNLGETTNEDRSVAPSFGVDVATAALSATSSPVTSGYRSSHPREPSEETVSMPFYIFDKHTNPAAANVARRHSHIEEFKFECSHFNLLPSGIVPDASKKTHCTHWLRTGTCAYVQQGCLYRHEIPESKRGWEALGFRTIPQWIQEKNTVRLRQPHNKNNDESEKQVRVSAMFASLRASKPDEDSPLKRFDTNMSLGIKSAASAVPDPLFMHPPTLGYPQAENGSSSSQSSPTMKAIIKPSTSIISSDNISLIDLATPVSSRSSSPVTIIAPQPPQNMLKEDKHAPKRAPTGIFVPKEKHLTESANRPYVELANPRPPPNSPVKSISAAAQADMNGYIHYFSRQSSTDVHDARLLTDSSPGESSSSFSVVSDYSASARTAQQGEAAHLPSSRFSKHGSSQTYEQHSLGETPRANRPNFGLSTMGSVHTPRRAAKAVALSDSRTTSNCNVQTQARGGPRKQRPFFKACTRDSRMLETKIVKVETERLKDENRKLRGVVIAERTTRIEKDEGSLI